MNGRIVEAMEQQLEEQNRKLEMFSGLRQAATTTRSFQTFFSHTVDLLEAYFDFDCLSISLYDAITDSLTLFALHGAGHDTDGCEEKTMPLAAHLRVLVDEQRSVHFADRKTIQETLPGTAEVATLCRGVGVPLRHAGKVVGVLAMLRREDAAYDAEAAHLLQEVADQIAPAVETARLEQQLRQHQERYRFQTRLLDTVEQGVIVTDPEGTITYWNRFAEKLFGWTAAEVQGRSVYEMTLPIMSRQQAEEVMAKLRAGESWTGEIILGHRDGTTFPALVADTPMRDESGEVVAIIGLSQDISERKALQLAAATVSSTLELDRVLDLILSEIGRVLSYESATIFLLDDGEAEIVAARNLPEETTGNRFAVDADPFLQEMNESGRPIILDDARSHPAFAGWSGTGEVRGWLAVPLTSPAGLIGYLTLDSYRPGTYDTTDASLALSFAQHAAMAVENARLHEDLRTHLADLKAAQTRLLQSEKLATIGELVAGVAHELNNPLAAILLYAQLLRQREGEGNEHKELDRIEEQTLRARDIVESLLDFARQRPPRYEPIQVNEVVESSLSLLSYRLQSHDIVVSLDLAPNLPLVEADPGQLQQVFVNVLNNAYQAIRDSGQGGQLSVRSQRSLSGFLPTQEAPATEMIRITFHNDGPSILPENLSNIFDPFFTTKEPGEGTGLGLAVSYGIIQEHGGHIWAENGPDEGVTFFVELPFIAAETAAMAEEEIEADGTMEANVGAAGRALVIDDEPSMRFGLQEALETLGFSTDSAADGHLGLAQLENNAYTLLLCDIRMPGLDGIAFFHWVQHLYPELAERIIFITGDAISLETRHFLEENKLPYLVKPFAIEALMEKVKEIV